MPISRVYDHWKKAKENRIIAMICLYFYTCFVLLVVSFCKRSNNSNNNKTDKQASSNKTNCVGSIYIVQLHFPA